MLPKTYSPPGDAYEPPVEEALQFGVWLMLNADNLNRKLVSYVDDNPAAGVRIREAKAEIDQADMSIVVPQQIVSVPFASVGFEYDTTRGGKRKVPIRIKYLVPYQTSYADSELPPSASPSVLRVLSRIDEILLRGTLYIAEDINGPVTTMDGKVVDPYRTPLLTEETAPTPELVGTYDPTAIAWLNEKPPDLGRDNPEFWLRRRVTDASKLDPVRDIAVAYGVTARYEIRIHDREQL